MNIRYFFIILSVIVVFSACEKEEGCDECGGTILDGYVFNEVTTDDLTTLGAVEGIEVGVCIRYKLDGTEFDLETVKVVDDCCCDQ